MPLYYGLPLATKQALLEGELPNGSNRYFGFYTVMPNRAGVGGTEYSAGSQRMAVSSWYTSITTDFTVFRVLNQSLLWVDAAVADAAFPGWGIWDAGLDGSLVAFGLMRTTNGIPRVQYVSAGDFPAITAGTIAVGLQ